MTKVINYNYEWTNGQDSKVTIDLELDDGKTILRMVTVGRCTTVEELIP